VIVAVWIDDGSDVVVVMAVDVALLGDELHYVEGDESCQRVVTFEACFNPNCWTILDNPCVSNVLFIVRPNEFQLQLVAAS